MFAAPSFIRLDWILFIPYSLILAFDYQAWVFSQPAKTAGIKKTAKPPWLAGFRVTAFLQYRPDKTPMREALPV
jgi:hypothetical protein